MFADPTANLKYLHLEPGMTVADFGVGSGSYAFAAANLVGGGRVFAIDVQKDLLDKVAGEARSRHMGNIELIWGDVESRGGTKLKDGAVDAVIISNILFQVDSQYALAMEAKRILRAGGQAVVIDWQDSYGGTGPAPDRVISPAKAEEIFTQAGFKKENSFSAGDHHYGLVFRS